MKRKKFFIITAVIIILLTTFIVVILMHKDEDNITLDVLTYIPAFSAEDENIREVDLIKKDISSLDMKDRFNDLLPTVFDTNTKWPSKSNMPDNFNPKKIMDMGKNPGLGVETLHKKGIKGKGISMAIIDGRLTEHKEYSDRVKLYKQINSPNTDNIMHGAATTSIAAGKTLGVAPEADIYYFALGYTRQDKRGNMVKDFTKVATTIDEIITLNKGLSKDNKIRVISMSMGIEDDGIGYKEFNDAVERAKNENIYVISSNLDDDNNTDGLKFEGLGRKINKSPNELDSYTIPKIWESFMVKESPEEFYAQQSEFIYFPMDARTVAGPDSEDQYVYYPYGSYSWAIPYVAGIYVLACDVYPDITPEIFYNVAMETSNKLDCEINSKILTIPHVIDPIKLIEALNKLNK